MPLVITADHGMVFPDAKGKGGHSADKYAGKLEALRVPLVFIGPGVEELNLGGRWSEMDIAPTVLDLLNISSNLTAEGNPLPICEGYNLRVAGAPAGVAALARRGIARQRHHGSGITTSGACRGAFILSNRAESPAGFW